MKFKIQSLKFKIILGLIFLCSTVIAGALLIFKIPAVSAVTTCQTQADPATRRADGLISSSVDFSQGTIFGNPTGTCVIDPMAVIPPYQIYSYDDLKSIFYTQSKLPSSGVSQQKYSASGNQTDAYFTSTTLARDSIHYISGNLTISNNITVAPAKTAVVFVDGDLNIGPITGNQLTYGSSTSGLVFVVKGDINIDSTVTQINAVLISSGTICTAFTGGACMNGTVTTPQLTVNGSLVSLKGVSPVKFVRNMAGNNNNTTAAEVINQQVKYLVILKDLFSQNSTYRIEDAIVHDIYPMAGTLGVNCAPENNPVYTGASVNWTANIVGSGSYSYAWSGDDITGSNTESTLSKAYSTSGTKNVNLEVRDLTTSALATVGCSPLTVNAFSLTCSPSVTSAYTGQSVDWTAYPNPAGAYTYSWSGTDIPSGSGNPLPKTYSTTSPPAKTASVTVGGINYPCNQSVTVTAASCSLTLSGTTTCSKVSPANGTRGFTLTYTRNGSTVTIPTGAKFYPDTTQGGNSTVPSGGANATLTGTTYAGGTSSTGTTYNSRVEMGDGNTGTNGGSGGTKCTSPSFTINYCTTPPSTSYKRVFATNTAWDGNLGGLTGADAKCNFAATTAGLGGSWLAWLADDSKSPLSGRGFIQSSNPYVLLNTPPVDAMLKKIAVNFADLLDSGLLLEPQITETKATLAADATGRVWTNTNTSGGIFNTGNHCSLWTSNSTDSNPRAGSAYKKTGAWISDINDSCSLPRHLYCFEQ